jgi:hypothetical protein
MVWSYYIQERYTEEEEEKRNSFGVQVLTTVTRKSMAFWAVIPCSSEAARRFGWKHRLHLHGWKWRLCFSEVPGPLRTTRPSNRTLQTGIRPPVSGSSSDHSTQLRHLSHLDSHYRSRSQTTTPSGVDQVWKLFLCWYDAGNLSL